jgi:hypothetical protein
MYESLLCIDFVTWGKCPASCLTISIIVIKNKSCGNANKYSKGRLNDSPNRTTTIPVLTATHGVCEKSTDSQAIFLLLTFVQMSKTSMTVCHHITIKQKRRMFWVCFAGHVSCDCLRNGGVFIVSVVANWVVYVFVCTAGLTTGDGCRC